MPANRDGWVIDVCLDARLDLMRAARKCVAAMARTFGASRAAAFDIEVALGEALANAYVHAYRGDGRGRIAIRLACDPASGLALTVRDRGRRLPARPRIPEAVPASRRRGRGLFLINRMMDGVEVIHPASRTGGTLVRMTKRLGRGASRSREAASRSAREPSMPAR